MQRLPGNLCLYCTTDLLVCSLRSVIIEHLLQPNVDTLAEFLIEKCFDHNNVLVLSVKSKSKLTSSATPKNELYYEKPPTAAPYLNGGPCQLFGNARLKLSTGPSL